MLRTIHLHGSLAKTFGDSFKLDVLTPAEAVRALCIQLKGFMEAIKAGEWRCIRGGLEDGLACDEDLLHLRFGSIRDFHLVPVTAGNKSGIGKILIGVLLIAASFIPGVQAITIPLLGHLSALMFGVGAMMALGGLSHIISPTPKQSTPTTFLFNGPVNTGTAGSACPLVFGRIRAGSVTVSAGIIAEQIGSSTYGSTVSPTGNISYVGGTGPVFF